MTPWWTSEFGKAILLVMELLGDNLWISTPQWSMWASIQRSQKGEGAGGGLSLHQVRWFPKARYRDEWMDDGVLLYQSIRQPCSNTTYWTTGNVPLARFKDGYDPPAGSGIYPNIGWYNVANGFYYVPRPWSMLDGVDPFSVTGVLLPDTSSKPVETYISAKKPGLSSVIHVEVKDVPAPDPLPHGVTDKGPAGAAIYAFIAGAAGFPCVAVAARFQAVNYTFEQFYEFRDDGGCDFGVVLGGRTALKAPAARHVHELYYEFDLAPAWNVARLLRVHQAPPGHVSIGSAPAVVVEGTDNGEALALAISDDASAMVANGSQEWFSQSERRAHLWCELGHSHAPPGTGTSEVVAMRLPTAAVKDTWHAASLITKDGPQGLAGLAEAHQGELASAPAQRLWLFLRHFHVPQSEEQTHMPRHRVASRIGVRGAAPQPSSIAAFLPGEP